MEVQGEKNKSTISVEYFNIYFKYFIEQLKISNDVDLKETVNQFDQSDFLEQSINNKKIHIFFACEVLTKRNQLLKEFK